MLGKLKQLQELKSQADNLKTALAEETIEGIDGNGQVKIFMDGNQTVQKVEIDPEILNNQESVQTGIKDATNDAIKKVQRVMAQKMAQMGGLNFPGL